VNGLLLKAAKVNGNVINGRSVAYSNLTEDERVQLAADAVTAVRPFIPSIKQAAEDFGTTPTKISNVLESRAAQQRQDQVGRLAETLRTLPENVLDAVIFKAGVGTIWDSVERLTR
jgi:hypothetical protein